MQLGVTNVDEETFMDILKAMADYFSMQKYNVMTNNCNNFTDSCA